jgi:hypothetical protein
MSWRTTAGRRWVDAIVDDVWDWRKIVEVIDLKTM